MNDSTQRDPFYRCPVQAECGQATLRIGARRIPITIEEKSIDGFTVTVAATDRSTLRFGKRWVLCADHDVVEVHPEWMFHAPNQAVQLGLRRLQDLTAEPKRRMAWPTWGSGRGIRKNDHTGQEIAFAGLLFLILALLSLPGLGDALGTAPRIQAAAAEVGQLVGRTLRSFW
jgi:hypothetical protein